MILPFLVACIIFALVGTGVRGVIRPLSWATLAIATLIVSYNGGSNFFNSTLSSTDSAASADPDQLPTPGNTTGNTGVIAANRAWYASTPYFDPRAASETVFKAEAAPPETEADAIPDRALRGSSTPPTSASTPSPNPVVPQQQPITQPPNRVIQNPTTSETIRGLW